MNAHRILIFDDDATTGSQLVSALARKGAVAACCDDVADALQYLAAAQADAVLVCTAAPAGMELLNSIRDLAPAIPVLLATPVEAVEFRIMGLNSGAIDYLLHPFDIDELLVRVATACRRSAVQQERLLRRGDVVLDIEVGRIGDGTRWTPLTPTEREAFSLLFGSGDRPVSKRRLRDVLGMDAPLTDNAIEVVIHRLRVKVHDLGLKIRTYRGAGYVLECE